MAAAIREDAPYREFAERLQRLRQEAGLTRAQLGEKVGVAGRSIINYENGERIPFGDVCARMAGVFGITTDELLGVDHPDLEMARAKAVETMRSINGRKGADRLQAVYQEAASLAGGDLTDDQLMEFSMEMQKMALLAQQRLTERFSNKRFRKTVEEKAQKIQEAVRVIDETIVSMTGGEDQG